MILRKILKIFFLLFRIVFSNNIQAQCNVTVDVANLQHVNCPNGGAEGNASVTQNNFTNYFWENITTGQMINSQGNTTSSNLDAGLYVITATGPFNSSCPALVYSDTFEILEAEPVFQFNPTQSCQSLCNVLVTASMQIAIASVNYTYQFDANPIVSLPNSLANQCGGSHTYEIFANGISCGIENIGISQFAQMNLATSVSNAPTCNQQGSATVNITGVGASAISTYCISTPQMNLYTTIDNIVMVGDNTTISNNTSGVCDMYTDYTAFSTDVTPGNSYSLTVDLGTCSQPEYLIDIANVYIDWNIDGDFNDINELVGQVNPTQSPSSHIFTITVPPGAIPGESRMRIVAQNYQYQSTNQALSCDNNIAYFGSTEDYTLFIGGSVATPVTYLWSDGQTTVTANNLSAGTYTVSITDVNGCSATDTAIVTGLLFGCINPLAVNYDPTAQCDDGSCISSLIIDTAFISQPILSYCQTGGMQININQTFPQTTYSCVVGYYSGTFFISYLSTNLTTVNQLNLSGFNPNVDYFVRIVDSTAYYNANPFGNGTSSIGLIDEFGPVNFSAPSQFTVTTSGSQIICNGTTPDSLTASSGVAGTYSWSPASHFLDANIQSPIFNSVLTATTTYTVIFTDSSGCTATDDLLISTTLLTTSITPTLQSICQNSPSSNLTVIAGGGVFPYQYQWYEYSSPNQASAAVIIPNEVDSFFLPPTNTVGITYYFCLVTSAVQACQDTSAIVTVETVSEPMFTLQPQDSAVCIGSNITINVADTFFVTVAANAIIPVYQWYENSICDTSISGGSVPASGPGNNTSTYTPQTTTPGTTYYYCTIIIPQIVGCNTIISECAEIIVNPIPSAILIANPNPACLGNNITLTGSASIPVNKFRFQYNNGGGWINMTSPAMGNTNPITYSNIINTTQFRVRVREYTGCPTGPWSPIITVPISIITTQPISHN